MLTAPAPPWDYGTMLAAYRATMARCAAWYDAADVFSRPALWRRDIVAADRACQAAWARQDGAGLAVALAAWERAICGTGAAR